MLSQPVYLTLPDSGFDTELLKQVKELEMHGVSAAEAGDLEAALQLFSQAIQLLPGRASAYNNRAQTLRLQGNTAGTLLTFIHTVVSEASMTVHCSYVSVMHS